MRRPHERGGLRKGVMMNNSSIVKGRMAYVTPLFAAAMIFLSGCWTEEGVPNDSFANDPACADLSCNDQLTLYVVRRDGNVFSPGTYVFVIGTEGPLLSCTVSMASFSCDGDTDMVTIFLEDARDTFVLRMDAAPQSLYVEVQRDEVPIGSEKIVPEYSFITSTNPDCTKSCIQGHASLWVSE